ncbi:MULTISPECIES: Uma2 family endonuclease [unclassified Microcoleus]|uniref:Uma2 family endonuclease n=1 Tax=unclassified Microcoleus TaxID=2642155 RepID=UPI0025D98B72|nr:MULTISPECIES: Uma2 family endonuclease [unclassified Microcoleus]
MVANQSPNYISPEEYLKLEELSQIKHEYIQGETYAMAGATESHVTICVNLVKTLTDHVRGNGCKLYTGDMKARIESRNICNCSTRGKNGAINRESLLNRLISS